MIGTQGGLTTFTEQGLEHSDSVRKEVTGPGLGLEEEILLSKVVLISHKGAVMLIPGPWVLWEIAQGGFSYPLI